MMTQGRFGDPVVVSGPDLCAAGRETLRAGAHSRARKPYHQHRFSTARPDLARPRLSVAFTALIRPNLPDLAADDAQEV